MLHLINWSHLPDLELTVEQKQGWLQWRWVGSEMAKHPQTCQESLTLHDWKQRGKEFVHCFSHLSLSGPHFQAWMNEICVHKHLKSQVKKPIQKKKLTPRKYKNWVANWRTEMEIWIYHEENKTQFSVPTLRSKKTKKWLEGVGELPAAEEAGKSYKGVHEAEYFVLPVTHLAQHLSCRQADIPIVTDTTS